MSPNERKNTLAKIVLVISILLLAASVINLLLPGLLSSTSTASVSSSQEDVGLVYEDLKNEYDKNSGKIKEANDNAKDLKIETDELNGYKDKNIPKYAIGGGLSIIMGLWISTIILYIKEKRSLFKE
ncbi:MAG: hypothetical protein KKI06_07575 [Euryarchaeota archaeon]|nr:hypothetical protein [Euryarchaeota archaeon]MBU4222261.1 hypothetical protein [Euryarchaeota archaeon]MCG2736041.1 hypothetical protein [Candidatus Methanoperedenaceae archaeon]